MRFYAFDTLSFSVWFQVLTRLFVSVMIQQPRLPSSGLLPASDVLIRAKEVSFTCYIVFWLINETE